MVSWLFPPQASVGSKRAYRFAKHLPEMGWEVTVVTRRRAPARAFDSTPVVLPDGVTVLREYDSALGPVVEDLVNTVVSQSAGVPRKQLKTKVPLARSLPLESEAVHAPHLARVISRELSRHDLLWTTSFPYHSHLVAMGLAKHLRKPWIADLRDPWVDNWNQRDKPWLTRSIERRFERAVLTHANAVVLTADGLTQRLAERFAPLAHKFVTVHNCFDDVPVGRSSRPLTRDRALDVVHFGDVYGPRSLRTVFMAMARLRDARSVGTIVLTNFGAVSETDRAVIDSLGLSDRVIIAPPLPWAEGVARVAAADVAILADWGVADGELFVPAKIFDYLTARTPVLAETGHSELRGIVARSGAGCCVDPGDVTAVCAVFTRFFASGAFSTTAACTSEREYFSARETTARLAKVFDKVLRQEPL